MVLTNQLVYRENKRIQTGMAFLMPHSFNLIEDPNEKYPIDQIDVSDS
jgi:hypothetical protein